MKAAIIQAAGQTPVYGEFNDPVASYGNILLDVSASALSPFSKSRSAGSHYSSKGMFPSVPGADGVGQTADGQRLYFVLPESPYGALAEKTLVSPRHCVSIPDGLDDLIAAALANPGMSAWTALVERAHLQSGETVLVNGATGSAGRLAVQLAKYLGARKVIATGRNESELHELRVLGADVVIPFSLDSGQPQGAKQYEQALSAEFEHGINVAVDYLWGESARTVIVAIAKTVEDGTPVRFVHVGGASRQESIDLPGAALRSSAIQLMGSGVKSVPMTTLLNSVRKVFEVARSAELQISTRTVPLSEVEANWEAAGKPRVVFITKR